MARVAGVNLPQKMHVSIALTGIFGIGKASALRICSALSIDPQTKVAELSDEIVKNIQNYITTNFIVEGDLRRKIGMNIKRYIDLRCYRGVRHKKGLPLRGQRTKTNAKTRKRRSGRSGKSSAATA